MVARKSLKIRFHVQCLACLIIRGIMDAQNKHHQNLYINLVHNFTDIILRSWNTLVLWSTFHTGNGQIPCGHSVNIHKREKSCQRIVLSKDGGRNGRQIYRFLVVCPKFFFFFHMHNVPVIVATLHCIAKISRVCS